MKMKWAMMGRNNAMACVGDGNRLAITNEALDVSEKLIEANPQFMTAWNYSKLPFEDKLQALINEDLRVVSSGCYNLQLDEICHYDESGRVAFMEEALHKFRINVTKGIPFRDGLRINEEMEMRDSDTLKRASQADMRWNLCLGLIGLP
ncbi:hypothetical protein Tco_0709891 [Tanacetum coccineum]